MTQEMGPEWAERFATAHENSGPGWVPNKHNQMDLFNNAVGRRVGETFSLPATAEKILLLQVHTKTLVWIESTPRYVAPPCWAASCTKS